MPGCGHLFACGRPLSRTRRSNARSQLPQASWLKVRRGAGANFSATERAHKWNGGQVDAEWRKPSLVTTSGVQRKSWFRRWMIGKRNGGRIHNVACNQSCCRWVSGRRRLSSRNQINISYVPLADPFPFVWTGAVQFFSISQRLFYLMFDTQFLPRRNRAVTSSAKTGFDAT